MKKKLFIALFVAAIGLLAGYNMYQTQSEMVMTNLALANVEALAMNENLDCPNGCMGDGKGCYCNGWYPYYKEYGS